MWLLTESGFISVVENRNNPDEVIVRARLKEDLERFCRKVSVNTNLIFTLPDSDYKWRVVVTKLTCARFAFDSCLEIDYDNFKGRVEKNFGYKVADAYLLVWKNLRRLQFFEKLNLLS